MADMLSQDEINALLMQAGGSDDSSSGLSSALEPEPENSAATPSFASAPVSSPVMQPQPAAVSFTMPQTTIQMPAKGDIGMFSDIPLKLSVFLGKTKMPLKEAMKLSKDSVIELDKMKGEPADIYVNNKLFARGEIVVIDENFGVRITKVIEPAEREELLKHL